MPANDLGALRLFLLAAIGCQAGETLDCALPESLIYANGEPTGFVRCADGAVNRIEALPVPAPAELPACAGDEMSRGCDRDDECAEGPKGFCAHFEPAKGGSLCACTYHCTDDADCEEGEVCLASEVSGIGANAACWPASCDEAADCPSTECGLSIVWRGCSHAGGLDCRDTLVDSCRTDDDCDTAEFGDECGRDHGAFACQDANCAIGRPLRIDALPRVAPAAARSDWSAAIAPTLPADPAVRASLAAHWTRVAALEHASVASFARFTLQLLALGAPAELVLATQEAAADEVRHARFAYGLASAYAGAAVGPGPLPLHDAMPALDAAGVLAALVEDACVGETLGAAEARSAAEGCVDLAVGAGLHAIAEDEVRHAALAWRTLRWLLDTHPELPEQVRLPAPLLAKRAGPDLAAWGLPSPAARAAVHDAAFRLVVEPVLAALLSTRPWSGRRPATAP